MEEIDYKKLELKREEINENEKIEYLFVILAFRNIIKN
jgi:hypothetical protein